MTTQPIAFVRADHVELAGALLRELGNDLVGDLGGLHAYDEAAGVWNAVPSGVQSLKVQGFAGTPAGATGKPLRVSIGDVRGAQTLAFDQVACEGFFADAPIGVAFANGFVSLDDRGLTLHPHSKDHRARFAFPFEYVDGARSDTWDSFLHALFRDDNDRDEKSAYLAEFFGAALLGLAPRYQRATVAKGLGENGKSKFGDIISAAMPPGAVCSIPPQDMGQEYRRAMLAGKRLNVVNELPEAEIISSESFKAIVTGDAIVGRHIREAPFMFKPEAGHYFAANRLPGTNDQSEGFWRRLVVIEFNRTFKNDPARDPDIANKIIRNDLPAVVGWMLGGAARLMKVGKYTLPASHARALEDWRMSADQAALFIRECTEDDPTAATGGVDLYNAYRAWAPFAGHRNFLARNTFGARLKLLGHDVVHTREGNVYRLRLRPPRCEGL